MKTYAQGIYEGLKFALKIIRLTKTKQDAHFIIEQHLNLLNSSIVNK